MGYPEKRGSGESTYYRGRYKIAPGRYGTVSDSEGRTIKYERKRDAKQAADRVEAQLAESRKKWVDRKTVPTFAEYVQPWWEGLDLAESTMDNYRDHVEGHLLPAWGDVLLTDITREAIEAWCRRERAAGYAASSVTTYRSILHLILADAIADGVPLDANPAARRRGRGRRSGREGRTDDRSTEKVVTSPLGALLVAERAAVLSGRDDEFVHVIQIAYTGMRWGESIGFTRPFLRQGRLRIEWQLYQKRDGTHLWCPPKDDSRRWADLAPFQEDLLADQLGRVRPDPCPCHGQATLFRGRLPVMDQRVSRAEIARVAGVSPTSVMRARQDPGAVRPETLVRVQAAVEQLGVDQPVRYEPHMDRADWRHAILAPAASGWYPSRDGKATEYPVPIDAGEGWPGRVLRGRYSGEKATACWAPVAAGLTTHGLRHTHASWLEGLGTPKVLIDERMGHVDASVSGRYKHVLPTMRARLKADLQRLWVESLDARLRLSPRSPVAILDRLLVARAEEISQSSPEALMRRVIQRTNSGSDLAVWK